MLCLRRSLRDKALSQEFYPGLYIGKPILVEYRPVVGGIVELFYFIPAPADEFSTLPFGKPIHQGNSFVIQFNGIDPLFSDGASGIKKAGNGKFFPVEALPEYIPPFRTPEFPQLHPKGPYLRGDTLPDFPLRGGIVPAEPFQFKFDIIKTAQGLKKGPVGMADDGDTPVFQGEAVGLFFHVKTPVGAPGGGYIPYTDGFEEIPEPHPDKVIIIGIYPGSLVPVVHVYGDKPGFNPHRVIQGIGIVLFKKEILIMVPQNFKKPALRGKMIKNLV
jgi:hypothetical protein